MSGWISVNDSLPEVQDGEYVSVLCYNSHIREFFTSEYTNDLGFDTLKATHWMPLKPPEESRSNDE